MNPLRVFVTGATGYIGRRLTQKLVQSGCEVYALARKPSADNLPRQCRLIIGDALDAATYAEKIPHGAVFIHLVGVAHPSPRKKQQFIAVDLKSIEEAVKAAADKNIAQFIYLSVAPSRIMKDFSAVRMKGEKMVRENFSSATALRPFYVLGPGHYWPLLLSPLFTLMLFTKAGREKGERLGLIRIEQMINALVWSIEHPPHEFRILEVKDLRKFSRKL
jgi:nucleoside-diphosphate-sugar epimerase